MALPYLCLAVYLFTANFIGGVIGQAFPTSIPSQQTTCSTLQQLSQTVSVCSSSESCCTRLTCSVFTVATGDFQILPCTTPPSISVKVYQGNSLVYNNTISSSQDVPLGIGALNLGTLRITVEQSPPSYDAITFGVAIGNTPIFPPTRIPIDRSQCSSQQPQDACTPSSPIPPTLNTSYSTPISPSNPTCQALQGIAAPGGIALPNGCTVTDACTSLDCNVLNLYPTKLTVVPCSDPPAIRVLTLDSTDGSVLVNETLTQSRTQPVMIGDSVIFDLIIEVGHESSPDAIILKVVICTHTPIRSRFTLINQTRIPIDRSNCSTNHSDMIFTPNTPIATTPATTVDTTCSALKRLSSSSGENCHTNPQCNSVFCDLNVLSIAYTSNLTVLPCLEVPGIHLEVISTADQRVILNQTFNHSRIENINLGATTVPLNVTVVQSPDQRSLDLQVDALTALGTFPIIPKTTIPIDRCSCPNIQCTVTTEGTTTHELTTQNPVDTPSSHTAITPTTPGGSPITPGSPITTDVSTSKSSTQPFYTTKNSKPNLYTTPNIGQTTTGATDDVAGTPAAGKSSNTVQIVVPIAVVAGVLLVALMVVVVAAVAYTTYIKKRNRAYSFQRMAFNEVKEGDDD